MKSKSNTAPSVAKVGSTLKDMTLTDLMNILDMSWSGIRWKAKTENWPFKEIPGNGGLKKYFPIDSLPPDVRKKVLVHFGELPAEISDGVPVDFDPQKTARCASSWDCAVDWQRELARARKDILDAWKMFRSGFTGTAKNADKRFIEQFSERCVPGLAPEIYKTVRKLKRSALHEWQHRFAQQGIAGLISQHGHNRGQTHVPLEQQRYILGTFQNNPNLKPKKIAAVLKGKFDGQAVTTRSVRLFLKQQARTNPQVFTFLENPDTWRSKHQLSLGSASEKAHRFLHYIEMDSTIADVTCSDGKRYNLCAAIDIFSRKAKFILTRTSSAWAIAGILRAVILDWGLPEIVITDNGKDYTSRLVQDAMIALEIDLDLKRPFHPEEKPHVERVIKTISHGLFETLPGYVGHNVAERKAIENRAGFAAKFSKKTGTEAGATPKYSCSIGLTPDELQSVINRWVEQDYHQDEHSSLGVSPNAKQASCPSRPRRIEGPRSLDILLAPAPKGETRTILKKGIFLDNQTYWDDGLIDYIGRKVIVRLDMRDAGRIFCFDPDTKAFICEALDLSISGITVGDMIAAKKRARKRMMEGVRAMKTLAAEVGDPLAEEIRQIREARATVTNLRVGDPVTDNPFVDAANKAAAALEERAEEAASGAPLFAKSGFPGPLPKNSQLFDDSEGVAPASLPVSESSDKVIPFATRAEENEVKLYFRNFRERFEWLKEAQRHRKLDSEEIRWLRVNIKEWWDYADMFCETWPEADRLWLGKIAPDHFPQYITKEDRK